MQNTSSQNLADPVRVLLHINLACDPVRVLRPLTQIHKQKHACHFPQTLPLVFVQHGSSFDAVLNEAHGFAFLAYSRDLASSARFQLL